MDGEETRLNKPDGEYTLEALDRGAHTILSGKVKTLKVRLVDGGSSLDASRLEAREIVFLGKIDGGSCVRLNAPDGRVEFRARIDGHARVEVFAPRGVVSFSTPSGVASEGSKIDGESQLVLTAREVDFRATINGTHTSVLVTLTEQGGLAFVSLEGGSRVVYRKADPKDPEPRLSQGTIRGAAQFSRGD